MFEMLQGEIENLLSKVSKREQLRNRQLLQQGNVVKKKLLLLKSIASSPKAKEALK